MALVVLNGPNIAPGESLSDALDCSGGRIVKITIPAAWTHASITFQTSTDGVGYNDIMLPDGNELSCVVWPGTALLVRELITGWLKIRSGGRERPVAQTAIRTFAVAIDTRPDVGAETPR